jgi:plasmid maintenance system killer protein
MIRNFKDRTIAKIWYGIATRHMPRSLMPLARKRLNMLDLAGDLSELTRRGVVSVSDEPEGWCMMPITTRWWIRFLWCDGECADVQIVDFGSD